MKYLIRTTLIIMAALTVFTACRDNDDDITPSGNYSPIRGSFPQGDTEYDNIINDIKKEYGVYLLYKDIREEDLNREWVSFGTGDIFVAGDSIDRDSIAWNLPTEQLPYYVDFFRYYIFPNITKKFAQSTFPVKIYMIHNLRTEPRDFGDDSEEEESEGSSSGTDTDPRKIIKLGDFDNWAISFPDTIVDGSGNNDYALKQMRCIFMLNVINNSIEKKEMHSPDEFWEGFDFHTKDSLKMNHVDPEHEYYKYKFGFIDGINDNFGTGVKKQLWTPPYADETSFYYWEKDKYEHYNLFTTYLKNAMWLTPEEFEAHYSTDKYPMIKEKYDIVVKHLLDTYGINLVGIARGEKKETVKE